MPAEKALVAVMPLPAGNGVKSDGAHADTRSHFPEGPCVHAMKQKLAESKKVRYSVRKGHPKCVECVRKEQETSSPLSFCLTCGVWLCGAHVRAHSTAPRTGDEHPFYLDEATLTVRCFACEVTVNPSTAIAVRLLLLELKSMMIMKATKPADKTSDEKPSVLDKPPFKQVLEGSKDKTQANQLLRAKREEEYANLQKQMEEQAKRNDEEMEKLKLKLTRTNEALEGLKREKAAIEKRRLAAESDSDTLRQELATAAAAKTEADRRRKVAETSLADVQSKMGDVRAALDDMNTRLAKITTERDALLAALQQQQPSPPHLTPPPSAAHSQPQFPFLALPRELQYKVYPHFDLEARRALRMVEELKEIEMNTNYRYKYLYIREVLDRVSLFVYNNDILPTKCYVPHSEVEKELEIMAKNTQFDIVRFSPRFSSILSDHQEIISSIQSITARELFVLNTPSLNDSDLQSIVQNKEKVYVANQNIISESGLAWIYEKMRDRQLDLKYAELAISETLRWAFLEMFGTLDRETMAFTGTNPNQEVINCRNFVSIMDLNLKIFIDKRDEESKIGKIIFSILK